MSNDLSRSILLQVAFKGAVQGGGTVDEISALTAALFELLEAQHARFGISLESTSNSGGGSRTPVSGVAFAFNGVPWEDFRAQKTAGTLKANYPDFKIVTGDEAIWMYSQDGSANEEAAPYVVAADAVTAMA